MKEITIRVEDNVYEQLKDMAAVFGTAVHEEAERFFMDGFHSEQVHLNDIFMELDDMDEERRETYLKLLKPEIVEQYNAMKQKEKQYER